MKKQLLSALLTLCMVLALLPVTALAADSDFVIKNGVLTKYNGPGGAVTIPNSVTSIGMSAFKDCSSLSSVTIPSSVTKIDLFAFENCSNLTSVTIPGSVTSIGHAAFQDCSSLSSVTIPDGVTKILNATFSGCSSLTSVTIPDSVTMIDAYAFMGCSSLTGVTIPNSVTKIGGNAFQDCSSLTSVVISNSVTSIGYQAFDKCSSLTSVVIPNSITSIDDFAFCDCYRLNSVTIPSSITHIGHMAFGCHDPIPREYSIDVYYDGSESQWEELTLGKYIFEYTAATIHFNGPVAPVVVKAVLSPQKLAVDGKNIDCEKYNIDGSNYFKLRDLAQLLSGTGSQFEVGYDEAASTVKITTGQAYTPAGGELATGADNSATAQPSTQSILIDGAAHSELTVYNIGGSNFFQLRELGNVLNFAVDYDVSTDTAIVRSIQK